MELDKTHGFGWCGTDDKTREVVVAGLFKEALVALKKRDTAGVRQADAVDPDSVKIERGHLLMQANLGVMYDLPSVIADVRAILDEIGYPKTPFTVTPAPLKMQRGQWTQADSL